MRDSSSPSRLNRLSLAAGLAVLLAASACAAATYPKTLAGATGCRNVGTLGGLLIGRGTSATNCDAAGGFREVQPTTECPIGFDSSTKLPECATIDSTDIAADSIKTSDLDSDADTPNAGDCVLVGTDTTEFEFAACSGGGGGVTDGDKGDITIGSSGTTYTIDADTIGLAELAACSGTDNNSVQYNAAGVPSCVVPGGAVAGSLATLVITADQVGTSQLDDGSDTPAVGQCVKVDSVDSTQFEYVDCGGGGDFVGPASATDNALVRFDTTTGKLGQTSVGILSDAGVLTGLTGITSSGTAALGTVTGVNVTSGADPGHTHGAASAPGTYSSAAGLLTAVKTVDGAASGLDADLIDGINSTAMCILAGQSGGQTINGGTLTTNDLTLAPNAADADTGQILFGDGAAYDATEDCIAVGAQACTSIANQSGAIEITTTTPATALPKTGLFLYTDSTGSPSAGFGSQIAAQADNSNGTKRTQGRLVWEWEDGTDTSEDAAVTIEAKRAGADTDVAIFDTVTTTFAKPVNIPSGGTAATSASAARTNLGLEIGTNVQAYDAELAAVAGLTSAANKVPYFTGSGTAAVADFSAAGRNLVDDADNVAMRSTLGLVLNSDVQGYDTDLNSWAGVTRGTGFDTAAAVNVGSSGAFVTNGGALGTPSSGTLTSCTGLPVSTGISGLGTGVATALAATPNATGGVVTFGGNIGAATGSSLDMGGAVGNLSLAATANIWLGGSGAGARIRQNASNAIVLSTGAADRVTLDSTGSTFFATASTTAKEAISVTQNDTDYPFADFVGTSGASTTASISTYTTAGSIQGFLQIEVNGTKYWLPYYSNPTP